MFNKTWMKLHNAKLTTIGDEGETQAGDPDPTDPPD